MLKSGLLEINISEKGYYTSVKVDGKELIAAPNYALVTACAGGKLLTPTKMRANGKALELTMTDGGRIGLQCSETPHCMVFEVTKVPTTYDAVVFGPLKVNIHEVVGDVIGVAQGDGVALGFQALNIKTEAGLPAEYVESYNKSYGCDGRTAQLSVGVMSCQQLAAVDAGDGTIFQLNCRNRSRLEYRQVNQLSEAMVLPVEGSDALIKGAKVAVFGCKAQDALSCIGNIEVEQGLPHPMFDGEWGKTARSAMRSYLISNFSEKDIDFVLDKSELAGFRYIYHSGPFADWGHFNWDKSFVAGGDEGVKALVDKAAKRGIAVGVHTLTNFTTTNDAYVTPVPSEHLLKQGKLTLNSNIDASQTTISIRRSHLFAVPMSLNAMMIDQELITFGNVKEDGDNMILEGCTRGAFGTAAAAHKASAPLWKLWDYPYKTLFPDLTLQDEFATRLADKFNATGLRQISFDGLEGCCYTGQDIYAAMRFVEKFAKGLDHNVLNDASRLHHYGWHFHTRMNWGEPWGEAMRMGQVENRIKNQEFFRRNLFPRMLGWFLIRLADRKFECTTLEDLEWALAEAAGFDAGYGMTINVKTLKNHGQIDQLLTAIRNWDMLREEQRFTPEQMNRLKDPTSEWHLEKVDDHTFNLYPIIITKPYHCSLGELQPGQPGGADWSVNAHQGAFAFRLKVEGDGAIINPSFTTPLGVISFECKVEAGQYLILDHDGTAQITDKNYNLVSTVVPKGKAAVPEGDCHMAFSCTPDDDSQPDVTVRFISRGKAEVIKR
ncbi:MAG: hypothetical protein ACI30V_01455 [Muribaculaceae bacterium]